MRLKLEAPPPSLMLSQKEYFLFFFVIAVMLDVLRRFTAKLLKSLFSGLQIFLHFPAQHFQRGQGFELLDGGVVAHVLTLI